MKRYYVEDSRERAIFAIEVAPGNSIHAAVCSFGDQAVLIADNEDEAIERARAIWKLLRQNVSADELYQPEEDEQ